MTSLLVRLSIGIYIMHQAKHLEKSMLELLSCCLLYVGSSQGYVDHQDNDSSIVQTHSFKRKRWELLTSVLIGPHAIVLKRIP